MAYYCIAVLTVTLPVLACAASLICYNCTGVTKMDGCFDKVSCQENEVCFKKRKSSGNSLYELGCIERQKCGEFANFPTGKSLNEKGRTQACFQCCSKDRCNSNLCKSKDPFLCVDDEKINCAYYNALFNFCNDVDKAKIVCPKYCNLCQVDQQFKDGNWTPWSNWSECDVTCENGTQLRTRSCTDPAPQYGGTDCLGNDTETKSCHRDTCPLHGGWNTWSTWSVCSVSCDIGMQHRDRFCTNPRPGLFGNYCLGNSRDDRICMPGACADGGWTVWGSWNTCSKSCAGGIISRSRTCSNPVPSITGKQCVGNVEQVSVCNIHACPEHIVAFTAYDLHRHVARHDSLLFMKTHTNFGDGYNNNTGKFICKVAGVYHFVVTLTKVYQDIEFVSSSLRINNIDKFSLELYPPGGGSDATQLMSGAGTFHLNWNDVVDVYGIPRHYYSAHLSYFTGFLITPDQ